jgi:hypothetical protein
MHSKVTREHCPVFIRVENLLMIILSVFVQLLPDKRANRTIESTENHLSGNPTYRELTARTH